MISPAEDGSPLTTAKMTGAELLRSLRAEADRITALGAGLRDRIDTLTDPTAAEAEVEAVRAGRRAARGPPRARRQPTPRPPPSRPSRRPPRPGRCRAAQAEIGLRVDAEKTLDQVRAEAARERDELRADLRTRAERAEHQADAYRGELDRLRAASPAGAIGNGSGPAPARTTRRAARTPAT